VFHYPLILVGFEGFENLAVGLAIFPRTNLVSKRRRGWKASATESWLTSAIATEGAP